MAAESSATELPRSELAQLLSDASISWNDGASCLYQGIDKEGDARFVTRAARDGLLGPGAGIEPAPSRSQAEHSAAELPRIGYASAISMTCNMASSDRR